MKMLIVQITKDWCQKFIIFAQSFNFRIGISFKKASRSTLLVHSTRACEIDKWHEKWATNSLQNNYIPVRFARACEFDFYQVKMALTTLKSCTLKEPCKIAIFSCVIRSSQNHVNIIPKTLIFSELLLPCEIIIYHA